MENIEINFEDPNLYIVGGSIITAGSIFMYYICNYKCSNNTNSEIELTNSQDISQDFNNINVNNEIETQTDIESQQTSTSTQTEDVEFYNMMGSQFDKKMHKYMRKNNRNPIYEYDEE